MNMKMNMDMEIYQKTKTEGTFRRTSADIKHENADGGTL